MQCAIVVAKEAQGPDHGLNTLGNLGNVGLVLWPRAEDFGSATGAAIWGAPAVAKTQIIFGARYELPTARPRARISDEEVSKRRSGWSCGAAVHVDDLGHLGTALPGGHAHLERLPRLHGVEADSFERGRHGGAHLRSHPRAGRTRTLCWGFGTLIYRSLPSSRAEAKMRTATVVRTTAVLILVAEVWACAASAQDAIKPGKWEISTVLPGYTQPPPGMQLGPGQSFGPEGLTTIITKCVSTTNPPFPPKAPPEGANSPSKMEKSDVNGDTATWTMNCGASKGATFNIEGIVHYHDDTLDGTSTSTIRTTSPSGYSLIVTSLSITGRYVGPCDPE
jgi:hypothetical protein